MGVNTLVVHNNFKVKRWSICVAGTTDLSYGAALLEMFITCHIHAAKMSIQCLFSAAVIDHYHVSITQVTPSGKYHHTSI